MKNLMQIFSRRLWNLKSTPQFIEDIKREILSQKISDKYEKLNPVIVQDALDMNVNLNTNFSQIKHEIAQL